MKINSRDINNSNRVFGLDLLRAVAILLVVFGHGGYLLENTVLNGFPYIRMIDGVDLFFVLSGFLIGEILLKEINRSNMFGLSELLGFWKRRWFRTLPNYYLFLILNYFAVYCGLVYTHSNIQDFNWKFIFFLQNFLHPFHGFFWESWSLSVEEWFYILSPVLLVGFLKFFSPKKSFFLITILMIVFPLLYRIHLLNLSINDFLYDIIFRKMVSTRLDSIAYGLLAAWIYYYYQKQWIKLKTIGLFAGTGLMIFIVNYHSANNSIYMQLFYFSLSSVSVMLVIPFLQNIKSYKGKIGDIITYISKISYSMYLTNLLIEKIIEDNFLANNTIATVVKYLLYWAAVIVFSTLIYKYFEKPVMTLRDKKPILQYLRLRAKQA